MLRKQLSAFAERNFHNSWSLLNGQTSNKIKDEVFVILTKESQSSIRSHICDFIGEMAASIENLDPDDKAKMPEESKEWKQYVPRMMELWMSKAPTMMEAFLKILSAQFSYDSGQFTNYKDDLFTVFQEALVNDDLNIKTAAVEAMTSWISILPPKDVRVYENLVPSLLDAVLHVLAKDEYQVVQLHFNARLIRFTGIGTGDAC